MVPADKFDDYNVKLQAAILNPTKLAFSLPTGIAFHRSVDREFAKQLDSCSEKVLSITNKLLALSAPGSSGKGKSRALDSQDDVVDNFHSAVVDVMDQLLERTDMCLDEFLGRSKPPAIVVNAQPDVRKARANVPQGRLDPVIQHASYLAKPQLKFKRKPNNDRNVVWQPALKHKYNAQVPSGYNLQDEEAAMPSNTIPHPYRYEILHTTYPARMFYSIPPILQKSFEETPFHWISTASDMQEMLKKLRTAQEIAVDLEYHNYRSYNGFVCLMQISTREEDFIVDTLCLREELEELNEVFTNPDVVKVFHGAESDIVWLQQNFNIYVVNLFDTFHASKVLEFPRHGLATLLEMYCDFTPDKRFQLADWRIRPLPQEMLSYARSDTHFLLYIYDNLRNALLDLAHSRSQSPQPSASGSTSRTSLEGPAQAFVREVLSRSRDTALRLYEQDTYDIENGSGPGGWDGLARKWNKAPLMANAPDGSLAKEVYKCVHDWRDRVARAEDESTRYVLANHYIFQFAEHPPADLPTLLNVFPSVPPVMKRKAKDLLDEIRATVTRCLSSKNTQVSEPEIPAIEEITKSMVADSTPDDTSIWSNASLKRNLATSSSLFGPPNPQKLVHREYVTLNSSLFGSRPSKPLQNQNTNNSTFQQVKSRVHSTMVVTPSVISVPSLAPEPVNIQEVPVLSTFDEQQIEMPFVPVSERQKQMIETVEDDSIVTVGQQTARKKRKRTKSKAIPEEDGDIEAFDYSTTSNILDANPRDRPEALPRKKQKGAKRGSGVLEYGNFPAPPKAHSQPKQGNQSHTFK